MEHQLSSFLRAAMPPAVRLLYGITQNIPATDLETIALDREQMEERLRKHFKKISYPQFFGDYAVDLAKIGIALPAPGAGFSIDLADDLAAILRAMHEYDGNVGHAANKVSRTRKVVLLETNKLINLGLLTEDGVPTLEGAAWLAAHPEPVPEPEKPNAKPKPKKDGRVRASLNWKEGDVIQWINLRCVKCGYFMKVTNQMLSYGRPVCPVDSDSMLAKAERGEKKGRW